MASLLVHVHGEEAKCSGTRFCVIPVYFSLSRREILSTNPENSPIDLKLDKFEKLAKFNTDLKCRLVHFERVNQCNAPEWIGI